MATITLTGPAANTVAGETLVNDTVNAGGNTGIPYDREVFDTTTITGNLGANDTINVGENPGGWYPALGGTSLELQGTAQATDTFNIRSGSGLTLDTPISFLAPPLETINVDWASETLNDNILSFDSPLSIPGEWYLNPLGSPAGPGGYITNDEHHYMTIDINPPPPNIPTVIIATPGPAGSGLTHFTIASALVATNLPGIEYPISDPSDFTVYDQTTAQAGEDAGSAYTGPVPGLTAELLLTTSDNMNVTSNLNNVWIATGAGMDAIDLRNSTGNNVLDGGTGSNFLTGGSGDDTFFIDDRNATANLWSTVNGFHAGDAATIWGVAPADFTLAWSDNKGAVGYTGLTLDATAPGKPIASLTLVGYSQADLTNGRLSVAFGTDPGSGSPYMNIQAH